MDKDTGKKLGASAAKGAAAIKEMTKALDGLPELSKFDKNGKYIPDNTGDLYIGTFKLSAKQTIKRKRAKAARKARKLHR